MRKEQQDTLEFAKKFGLQKRDSPEFAHDNAIYLWIDLIAEEQQELEDAEGKSDFPEFVDAIVDFLYVTYGLANACGVDLEPIWDEVHRTNMLKEGGGRRKDGKILKPEGWKPPRVAELLAEQGWFCGEFSK